MGNFKALESDEAAFIKDKAVVGKGKKARSEERQKLMKDVQEKGEAHNGWAAQMRFMSHIAGMYMVLGRRKRLSCCTCMRLGDDA